MGEDIGVRKMAVRDQHIQPNIVPATEAVLGASGRGVRRGRYPTRVTADDMGEGVDVNIPTAQKALDKDSIFA